MLVEEDGVERRDQLDLLVGRQGLGFAASRRVVSQPLQEGLVFFAGISLEILLVGLVAVLLTRMWRTELLRQLVRSGHLDVRKLEGLLRSQETDAPRQ